jgi:hypothetical protein
MAWTSHASSEIIIPRLSETPVVDGRLDSPRWDAEVWEYNQRGAGAGVGYDYNNNDGLHITLADDSGIDALLVRGGAKAVLYGDGAQYDNPANASQLATLSGIAQIQRVAFPFEPEIDSVPGAPEWAIVARQAWLTARAVPEWWLEHRLAPTGEFGGEVGDDSDMYQNLGVAKIVEKS